MFSEENLKRLIEKVTDNYSITEDRLFGKSRVAYVVEARHVFCYCLRKK